MNLTLLGAIPLYAQILAVILIIVSILLIILVLLQKGRGGGLSAAFGGAGGQSAFGSKTGDVFTWATIVAVGLFLLLCIFLTTQYVPVSEIDESLQAPLIQPKTAPVAESPAPAAEATAPAPAAETDAAPPAGGDASGAPQTPGVEVPATGDAAAPANEEPQ